MIDQRKFAEEGYCIEQGVLEPELVALAEDSILDLYWVQLRKISTFREAADALHSNGDMPKLSRLAGLIELAEATDKPTLYEVQRMIASCDSVRALFSSRSANAAFRELLPAKGPLLNAGPSLFINAPQTERLLYRWHSEAHYYPKRRAFLNVWMPIFSDRDEENGAMSVVVGSHLLRDLPFSDYAGGAGTELDATSTLTQYEIPESFLAGMPVVTTTCNVGDVVIFDRSTVHRSNPNSSSETSFALVTRLWTTERDLTVSGDFSVFPYVSRSGRAGLTVDF